MEQPFPDETAFRDACAVFLKKYGPEGSFVPQHPRQQAYLGWDWGEHKTKYTSLGYLVKRSVHTLPLVAVGPNVDGSSQETESESAGLEEEENDSAALRPQTRKVNVEYTVLRSPTYAVPQLYIRAWDETGAPLQLKDLLPLLSLPASSSRESPRPDTSAAALGSKAEDPAVTITEDAVYLPTDQTFPLLQFAEHPISRLGCWSVHPCHVGEAVGELVASNGQSWLETWFMLSGAVVDLT